MKQGFMLIELIVATLVASMVAAILLAALTQGNRFQMLIDNTINTSLRIGIVSNQLEKDLMGAFIPVQAEKSSSAEATVDKPEDVKKDKQAKESSETLRMSEEDKGGPEKKEEKPLEKIFYSTNKNGKFDTLTFITNNPLEVFVGKDVGVVKPKVVRVQYSLKPEADKKDSYALFRQESMELDLGKYKDVREYEVIGGIKNCTMTFTARIEPAAAKASDSAKASSDKPADKKIEYEYKVLNEWVSEQKKDAEKDKAEFPRIPYSVEIKLALWDIQDKREKEYTIVCNIPVDFSAPKKEDKKQPEQPKKEEEQPAGAPQTNKNKQAVIAQNNQSGGQDVYVYSLETLTNKLQNLTKIFGRT